ncbi:heat shock 70 kDa protein 12B-like [Dreissena polymorpha]|uniref:heat shock 70 kDa protein 12B-like n=1 Tax=Dreissena polymorpha TaxID=45954 RepID=UPI002264A56D|nr:heat shock 70 kDa protein 12B-like [Dreissena polymorpha]
MSSDYTCIVAAFDFGTTYSGYAFSLKESPTDVKTNEKWYASSGLLVSLKTPTCVLLNEAGEFLSFGFDAEEKYYSLTGEEKHHRWRLFSRFKMALHNEKVISHSTTIEDLQGKPHPAKPIFIMSIRYLQQHLLKTLELRYTGIKESDIKYIITVPAIWGIAAKQFMREAAIEAGIDSKRLKLALEPEAAAIWSESLGHTLEGQKFLVVDIGGGTADISAHQKMSDGSLKNIHAPSGGPWGGIYVDENFLKFIRSIFGENSLESLKSDDMYDFIEILRDFEMKKRKFKFDSNDGIIFRIPIALKAFAEKHFHLSLLDRLKSLNYGDEVYLRSQDKLGVNSSVMQRWFAEPVSKMVEYIQNIIQEERNEDLSLIILVGGFAESPYVQQRIQEALPDKRLIVPGEAGLAVLKGAVMFGRKPDIISSRVMDCTYGIKVRAYYRENLYPVEKKEFIDGEWRVRNVFEIFLRINEDVPLDSKVTHTNFSRKSKKNAGIPIYRTKEKNPVYVTDRGCELLGQLKLQYDKDTPLGTKDIEVTFMFGDTELHVMAKDTSTGKVESMTLDLNK